MQDIFDRIDGQEKRAGGAGLPGAPAFIRPGEALEEIFADDQLILFQKRTALFLRRSFPAYAASLSADELEKLAVTVQKRAGLRGFTTEKQIWYYLIAVVYCGFFFDQDIQYADMLSLIGWPHKQGDTMLLLDRLLDIIDEYALECEKDFVNFGSKLRYIAEFYAAPHFGGTVPDHLPAPQQQALAEEIVSRVFPVRSGLWTPQSRRKLVAAGLAYAGTLGFSAKDRIIYLLANVYFGRAFELSPLYPWAYFLQNRAIPASERARHFFTLAQKHLTLLAKG